LPACLDPNQTDGSLNTDDTLNTATARVSGFTLLGTPSTQVAGFQPGQPAYVIEAAGITGPWHGGVASYAVSVF
jgi:hypothetical protein